MTLPALGGVWQHFAHCESTNDELIGLARAGAVEGTVVTADAQGRGRGRQGRAWYSPAGENLYLSVLLRPPLPPHRAPPLCLAAGLALFDAVDALLIAADCRPQVELCLKWPNDLLAKRSDATATSQPNPLGDWRKLGGILTELFGGGGNIDFVVIGVGINVLARNFPADVPATSLHLLQAPSSPSDAPAPSLLPRQVAERYLLALAAWYERYLAAGTRAITEPFATFARLGPQHPEVVVKLRPDEPPLRGIPIALGSDCELLLKTAHGIERVLSGDVAFAPLRS